MVLAVVHGSFPKTSEARRGTGPFGSEYGGKGKKVETLEFEVESIPLCHIYAVGSCNRFYAASARQNLMLLKKPLLLVYGSNLEDVLNSMSYQGHGDIPFTFPWRIKEIHHIREVPAKQKVVVSDDGIYGCRHALHLDQRLL